MRYAAVVLGASFGGLQALSRVLAPLPSVFPLPLMVVQHRPPSAETLLASLLDRDTALRVKDAEDKEQPQAGVVYIAPANYHLLVEPTASLALSVDAKVCYSRPSVDVLFHSAAECYRQRLLAVLLTGANHDGASGMCRVRALGGYTLAQCPEGAVAATMPQTAITMGGVDEILSLEAIAARLITLAAELS